MSKPLCSVCLLASMLACLVLPSLTQAQDERWYGIIASRPAGVEGTWTLQGRQVRSFWASNSTRLIENDGVLVVGTCAAVRAEGDVAVEIESEPLGMCPRSSGDIGDGRDQGNNNNDNNNDNARCFEQDKTPYCISGRIREFWEQNGGLPVFGYPITPQRTETIEGASYQVQWFERNRLELHPENPRPYDVLLGRLGVDRLNQQRRDWQTFSKDTGAKAGCRYFPTTGQNVCGDILAAWRADGLEFDGRYGKSEEENLALFGLPISPMQTETIEGASYQVQWFERARFELHPDYNPPYHVLLGLLGNELSGAR